MLLTKRADLISAAGNYRLVKLDFTVAGVKKSPKASGNRCILAVDEEMGTVRVLLVYSKNDITAQNETQEWKKMVAAEYPDIKKIFGL